MARPIPIKPVQAPLPIIQEVIEVSEEESYYVEVEEEVEELDVE